MVLGTRGENLLKTQSPTPSTKGYEGCGSHLREGQFEYPEPGTRFCERKKQFWKDVSWDESKVLC